MQILAPSFPYPPQGELRMHSVRDATITTFGHGRLRVAWRQPSWFTTGGVYNAAGDLVPGSQRIGGLSGDHALAADPPRLPPATGPVRHLAGTWLFGGTWFNHFGHFLTETVTTLWPDAQVDGLTFVPFWFGSDVLPWQHEMLELTGHDGLPEIVGVERLQVERLLVPRRPVLPNGHARPEAVAVWRRIAETVGRSGARRVFLSRSLHNTTVRPGTRAARRVGSNEAELDRLMAELGYAVVHPERLSVREQVAAVSGAEVLVGTSGSALHLSVFAPRGALVVEIGDARRAPEPVINQQILALASEQRLGFIPFTSTDGAFDLSAVSRALAKA